jgi:hypothetical protein
MISGSVGGFVFRRLPDGSLRLVIISRPRPGYKPSPAQAAQLQRFKDASAHCRILLADDATRAAYERLLVARGPLARLRALVMGDIMKPPRITCLDLAGYRGLAGGTIRVCATDNVAVARLLLVIHDCTTQLDLETAQCLPQGGRLRTSLYWLYPAQMNVAAGHTAEVRLTAFDLAGNRAEACQTVSP